MIPLSTRHLRLVLGVVLAFFACGFAGFAATPSGWLTRAWQTDDGLPNNQVLAITQSPDGYLWIGTTVGLTRFDGVQFTDFPYSHPATNEDQGVNDLWPARDGGLWIRMRRGPMVRLSPDFSSANPAGTGLPDERALSAIEDPGGDLWIAYPDSIWRVKNGQATRVCGYENMPTSGYAGRFAIDCNGNLWASKGNGVYLYEAGQFVTIAHTTYRAHLTASRSPGVWIASGKQLLKCYTNGVLEDFGSFFPADNHAGSTAVLEDHAGAVWIGTSSGLFRHTAPGFEKIETSHPDILSLAEDREGNIWAGTGGGGLDRISRRSVVLEGPETGASPTPIQSICEDTNGTLWGATQDGRLVTRANGTWIQAFTNAPWTNAVDSVATDRHGTLWIGSRNGGLYRWRKGQFTNWDMDHGFASRVILNMLPASNGDVWIVGEASIALQYLHNDQLHSIKLPRTIGRITALTEDKAGTLWVGSEMGALLQVQNNELVDKSALIHFSKRAILCLYPRDGTLWIGYEGTGLGRLKENHYAVLDASRGLPDDYISQIVADHLGWFWFGGERGIFKIRHSELAEAMDGRADPVRAISYGKNEGLLSMEASSANVSPYVFPGAFCSRAGYLWFPLRKALAVVDSRAPATESTPPPVLLSQVVMDGKTIATRGGLATDPAIANLSGPAPALRLPPSHRHLEFHFAAIHLSAPESVRFRYQLVGFDNDWIEAGAERMANYSRLANGEYEFRIESALADGPWSQTPAILAFSVSPFFWQTWWFRLGVLTVFTSLVIALVRYISLKRLQAHLRLIEQRAALDKERTRIARDLHDDLGCSLNKVALTLDMTQRSLETTGLVNGKIRDCSTMVRQAAKSVDEIVWAINPRNDTLRYMVDYISQFAVEFLHAAEISCRVDLPDNLPAHQVSPEARHNVFLVVKEALNNIARHAQATEVRLQVTASNQEVTLVIEDNGRGFDQAPDNASADGLRNMRQRMEEIGGQYRLESKPGAGTRVTFSYAWPPDPATAGNPNMPFPSTPSRRI